VLQHISETVQIETYTVSGKTGNKKLSYIAEKKESCLCTIIGQANLVNTAMVQFTLFILFIFIYLDNSPAHGKQHKTLK